MIIKLIYNNTSLIKDLLLDQYGIFIVHKLIEKTNGQLQMSFLTIIAQNIKFISLTSYNQKVINVLYTKYPLIRQIELFQETQIAYYYNNMTMHPNHSFSHGLNDLNSNNQFNNFNMSQNSNTLTNLKKKSTNKKKP